MARLNNRQRTFISEYLQSWNATQAALKAGYSPRTAAQQGSRLLKNVKIAEAIQQRLGESAMRAGEVLSRLTQHAQSDMSRFIDDKGRLTLASIKAGIGAGHGHLIKKIAVRDTQFGLSLSLELHDVQNALVQLGRFHKLFTDKLEITDWRMEAVVNIKAGEVDFEDLAEELGHDLATELFQQAGVPVAHPR